MLPAAWADPSHTPPKRTPQSRMPPLRLSFAASRIAAPHAKGVTMSEAEVKWCGVQIVLEA
jgi:hypothetical protein